MIAMRRRRCVAGWWLCQASVTPSTFSGALFQISWPVAATAPMPCCTASVFHGSPTQKPSMMPRARLSHICSGGSTMMRTSRSGSTPPARSHMRSWKVCIENRCTVASVSGPASGLPRYPLAQRRGHARGAGVALTAERFPQRPRQRDRVAVQAERQAGQQVGAHAAGAEPGHHRQRRQQVRGVELAHHQLVAQIRPRHLARERDLEPVTREQPGFTRHHQRRAVAEAHEAQRQRGLFRRRKLLVATHRLLPLSLPPGDSVASTVLATSGSRWLASIASRVSIRCAPSSLSFW
jgi:hypothetical protein